MFGNFLVVLQLIVHRPKWAPKSVVQHRYRTTHVLFATLSIFKLTTENRDKTIMNPILPQVPTAGVRGARPPREPLGRRGLPLSLRPPRPALLPRPEQEVRLPAALVRPLRDRRLDRGQRRSGEGQRARAGVVAGARENIT